MARNFGAEELPAAVTVVCDVCGRPVTTRLSGNTTRCPKRAGGCGAPITVPTGSTRPPVAVDCYACGHRWNTRAREGGTVRCPECSHPRRIPTGCRDRIDPGAPRVYREQPTERPAPARPSPREDGRGFLATLGDLLRPPAAPPGQMIGCLHCPARWRTTAAPGNAVRCPKCRRMRRIPTGPARPAPAPRKAPAAPAPRRAPAAPIPTFPALALPVRAAPTPAAPTGTAPGPIDPGTLTRAETDRRDRVCQVVRSLSAGVGLLVWYNRPPGYCEALDTTQLPDAQCCPQRAAVAVRFVQGATDTHAYACRAHAGPLAALANRSEHITATVHPLRGK